LKEGTLGIYWLQVNRDLFARIFSCQSGELRAVLLVIKAVGGWSFSAEL